MKIRYDSDDDRFDKLAESSIVDATVTAFGKNAGGGTGIQCTALGAENLTATAQSGDCNTSVGYNNMAASTTAYKCTAFGVENLRYNTTGYHNMAMGFHALTFNTIGNLNTAVGNEALDNNIAGCYNTALGHYALKSAANTSISYCTAVGCYAASNNTGEGITAVGYRTLYYNTAGTGSTAVGDRALENCTGNNNTAIGRLAGNHNTSGDGNTGVGYQANNKCTTGNYNTGFGGRAVQDNTTGTSNTGVGFSALSNVLTSGNIGLGAYAGRHETGNYKFIVDSVERADLATMRDNSLLYGTMGASASTEWLKVNGQLRVRNSLMMQDINGNAWVVTVTASGALSVASAGETDHTWLTNSN